MAMQPSTLPRKTILLVPPLSKESTKQTLFPALELSTQHQHRTASRRVPASASAICAQPVFSSRPANGMAALGSTLDIEPDLWP
jgi:hypothetical protein